VIIDGVRAWARRAPDRIAVREAGRSLTFGELVRRADSLAGAAAHELRLEPGAHVAVMAPNCLEFAELLLGLGAAGVAPALVGSAATPAELAHVYEDSEARVLFVHGSLEEVAREAGLDPVVLGPGYESLLALAPPRPLRRAAAEDDPFLLPYTAGTTGTPKGVVQSHRSKELLLQAMAREYPCLTPDDRTLAIAPFFHGAGFAWSLGPILHGGEVAVMPIFHPELVLRALARLRITNVFLVPAHLEALLALGDAALDRHDLGALRTIVCGSAPVSQSLRERVVERFGEGVFSVQYGATEAGIITRLRPEDQLRKPGSVGQPFPGVSVRLFGDELGISSPYLFDGYWRRPEETARALRDGFVVPGDLAELDDEGYVYLLDRKDETIISGGLNVHPREVEDVLASHPAVAEAAVFGVEDERLGEVVAAAVVLRTGEVAGDAELLAFCASRLARYKRPAAIRVVDGLPRNAGGKVVRRELRERW
jgi:long-chain acyl-CoA synthetase